MAGGYLTDKWGFRPVQMFSLVLSGIFFVLFGMVSDFTVLCFLIVALSFFVEAFKPANITAIAAYSKRENLTRSYALNRLAMNIGFGFGTSVGGILAAINYHLLFWVDGVVYVLAGLLILVMLPKRKVNREIIEVSQTQSGTQSPWRDAFFVRFLIMVSLYMICFSLLFRFVPVYWKEQMHIGESTIGILLGMNGLVIALFEMVLIQNLRDRRPDFYYIIAGTVFSGFAFIMLLIPAVAPIVLAAATVLLFTTGEMLALPYISTFVMSRSAEENRGKYSAAYSVSQSGAQIFGPAAGGLIAAEWGYNALWFVLVLISFACAIGFKALFQSKMHLGSN
jgi:predicted MFS family arabinose efflux permease